MTTETDGHLPAIPAGSAPGTLYIRIGSVETGGLLSAHPLPTLGPDWDLPRLWAEVRDAQRADDDYVSCWLLAHPTDEVHVYVYDGDTGECIKTIVVKGNAND